MKCLSLIPFRPRFWRYSAVELVEVSVSWGFPAQHEPGVNPWVSLAVGVFGFGLNVTVWPKGKW